MKPLEYLIKPSWLTANDINSLKVGASAEDNVKRKSFIINESITNSNFGSYHFIVVLQLTKGDFCIKLEFQNFKLLIFTLMQRASFQTKNYLLKTDCQIQAVWKRQKGICPF